MKKKMSEKRHIRMTSRWEINR